MINHAETCPNCSKDMQVNTGYVTWCSSCNWNLNPKQTHTKRNLVERLNQKVGEKAIKSIHDDVMNYDLMVYPLSSQKVAAYLLATVIHSFTLFCFYQAIYHFYQFRNLADFILGIIFTFISYQLFPRFGKLPQHLLSREQYPAIHILMDSIAEKLNTKPVDYLAFSRSYNAYYTRVGLFQKSVIGIGIPMFSSLDTREKIAILAHEVAHNANKDISRGWYVGRAFQTLSALYNMITPDLDIEYYTPRLIWIRMKLATVIFGVWYLLGISVWREMQRAEYYADRLAATVAGTANSVTALEKFNYEPTFYLTLERVAQFRYTKELFDEFRRMTGHVPEREKLRLERILQIDAARLDATHPPIRYRFNYLNYHQTNFPALELDQASIVELEAEFAKAEKSMQHGILDDYRSWYLEAY